MLGIFSLNFKDLVHFWTKMINFGNNLLEAKHICQIGDLKGLISLENDLRQK